MGLVWRYLADTLSLLLVLIYLPVSRALPTVVLTALWIYFFLSSDQVSEVIFSISDNIYIYRGATDDSKWIGVWQYWAYWLASLLLGAATATAMRWQFCTWVPRVVAWPFGDGRATQAISRYHDRVAVVFGAVIVGFLNAYYVGEAIALAYSEDWFAFLSFLVAISLLIYGIGAFVKFKFLTGAQSRRLVTAAAIGLSTLLLWFAIDGLEGAARLSAVISVQTIALVIIWFLRTATAAPEASPEQPRQPLRPTTAEWVVVGLLAFFYLAMWTSLAAVSWRVGSAPIVLVILGLINCVLSGYVSLVRQSARKGPMIAATAVTLGIALILYVDKEKLGREVMSSPVQAVSTAPTPPAAPPVRGSVVDFETLGAPGQLAIHADGGGIRAAQYTASVLAFADDLTCGDFGTHVRFASGVSGGSLGIATWAVLRDGYVRRQRALGLPLWPDCNVAQSVVKFGATLSDIRAGRTGTFDPRGQFPLARLVRYTLAQDHLSAPIAKMLTWDIMPAFLGGNAQRGQALIDSWESTARAALASLDAGAEPTGATAAFATPLSKMASGLPDRPPILAFNATDVSSGVPVIFTNSPLLRDLNNNDSIQIGVAALNSARFPIVSPAGVVPGKKNRQVVDGGYYDNSGAWALAQLLKLSKRYLSEQDAQAAFRALAIARLNGNVSDTEERDCRDYVKASGYPVEDRADKRKKNRTILAAFGSVRTAHSQDGIDALQALDLGPTATGTRPAIMARLSYAPFLKVECSSTPAACAQLKLDTCRKDERSAPLGWAMSTRTAFDMEASAMVGAVMLIQRIRYPDAVLKPASNRAATAMLIDGGVIRPRQRPSPAS